MEQEGKPSRFFLTWSAVNNSQSGRSLSWRPGSNDQNLDHSEAGSRVFLSRPPPWTWPKGCLLKNPAEKASGPNFADITGAAWSRAWLWSNTAPQIFTLLLEPSPLTLERFRNSLLIGKFRNKAGDGSVRKLEMDQELNASRLGYTWACFFTRELSWTELMLHKYRQSVLTRKHKQISNGASLPYKICREQLTFDLWTPQFLHVSPFLCGDGWRWKRWWWTSKHKLEVTLWCRRWPRCCRSGFTGAPEPVDQNRLIRTVLRNTGEILTEN